MTKLVAVILVSLALSIKFSATVAQQPSIIVSDESGWHIIGETIVDFQRERDEILVLGADRFASIKFKALDAPIKLQAVEVYFEGGDTQKITTNRTLRLNRQSRVINLKGGERNLKKIAIVYKTLPNRKDFKARVQVWGLKTNLGKK